MIAATLPLPRRARLLELFIVRFVCLLDAAFNVTDPGSQSSNHAIPDRKSVITLVHRRLAPTPAIRSSPWIISPACSPNRWSICRILTRPAVSINTYPMSAVVEFGPFIL